LGILMIAEALLLLWIGWTHFGLASDNGALNTFSFLTFLFFAVFSIISARERRRFWATKPCRPLVLALLAAVLAGTALAHIGLPGLAPLPGWQTLAIFLYAMVVCLGVNDTVKVAMIRWRLPAAQA